MFNEKSTLWIRIYKYIAIVLCFVFCIFGLIAGIGDLSCEFLDIDIGGDTIFDLIIWFVGCSAIGWIQLVFNMLVIQLLNNVQIIREKAEENNYFVSN